MKDIKKRGLLMLVAIIVLAGVIIASSLAWYTKMISIQSLSFKLARWDFNANYQVDDLAVSVNEYTTIGYLDENGEIVHNSEISPGTARYAAPGTAGTISLRLSAENSNVNVNYSIKLDKSTMSEEFQKRIYFYYLNDNNVKTEFVYGAAIQNGPDGTITHNTFKEVTLYWEWVYDYDEYLRKSDFKQYEVAASLRAIYDSPVGTIISDDMGNAFEIYEWRKIENLRREAVADGATDEQKRAYFDAYNKFMKDKYGNDYTEPQDMLQFLSESHDSLIRTYGEYYLNHFSWYKLWSTMSSAEKGAIRAIRAMTARAGDDVRNNWLAMETPGSAIPKPGDMTNTEYALISAYVNKVSTAGTPVNDLWKKYTSEYEYQGYRLMMDIFDKMLPAERQVFFQDEGHDSNNYDTIYKTIVEISGGRTPDIAEIVREYINANGYTSIKSYFDSYLAAYEEFDEFDTRVGLSPSLYAHEMKAMLHLSGVQHDPTVTDSTGNG